MHVFAAIQSLWSAKRRNRPPRRELMAAFQDKYANFQTLLAANTELLGIIADIERKLDGQTVFGSAYNDAQSMRCIFHTARMVRCLEKMAGRPYPVLDKALAEISSRIKTVEKNVPGPTLAVQPLVVPYTDVRRDSADLVGSKNANLGEIMNTLGIPTPRGFAITTAAFRHFIRLNDLLGTILRMRRKADLIETETILEVSQTIQQQILSATVPRDLATAIGDAYEQLAVDVASGSSEINVTMRSSALGEDSSISFAGQYLSVLNLPPQRMLDTYCRIAASLFSPEAIAYRQHMGISFDMAVMAVACQETIDAKASGVMFTRNPVDPTRNQILIDAVWGLGPFAVEGIVPTDTYTLSKDASPVLIDAWQVPKEKQLVAGPGGDLMAVPVPAAYRQRPCLTESQACRLAEYGLRLETYFSCAQDVEWALDRDDRLIILQARPLRVHAVEIGQCRSRHEPVPGFPVVLEGGQMACAGVGFGPVVHVHGENDVAAFPDGAVLVSPLAASHLVVAMAKAAAIVTDTGNVSGHMASLAREHMTPTIINLKNATATLAPGSVVTVDAFSGRVYRGCVRDLIETNDKPAGIMFDTPIYKDLRRRADLIVPLNLKDTRSPRFTTEQCRTIHDIMRFVHETAYMEILQLGDLLTDQGGGGLRLKTSLPLELYAIDLGGGLAPDTAEKGYVQVDQVVSLPFSALLDGMLCSALQTGGSRPANPGGFFSAMTRQMHGPPNLAGDRFGGRSYAIISDRYMNFSSRVGHCCSLLDAYCSKTEAKNYINFRFNGGPDDDTRCGRCARVIENVLNELGFLVNAVADRVTARIAKQDAGVLTEKLDQIGRLLIFIRQMDMFMHSDVSVPEMAAAFRKGDYHFIVRFFESPAPRVPENGPRCRSGRGRSGRRCG